MPRLAGATGPDRAVLRRARRPADGREGEQGRWAHRHRRT